MTDTEKQYTPILPFDITYGERMDLYENAPYQKNNDVCNPSTVKMESGNVCKYYYCKEGKPVKLGGN